MAHLDGFDANKVEPNAPMQPVPADTYLVMITGSIRMPSKSGNGDLMKYELQIADGKYKGRKIYARLNLWNKNDVARDIAWGDQSAICRAVGIMQPNDTTDLHNIPFEAIVTVTDDGKYNEIKGYQKRTIVVAASTPATPDNKQSTDTGEKPGWMGSGQ